MRQVETDQIVTSGGKPNVKDAINETLRRHPDYRIVGITEETYFRTTYVTVYYEYEVEPGYRESAK